MRPEKFITMFLVLIAAYLFAHAVIWKMFTEELITQKGGSGDLARMAYLHQLKQNRTVPDTLKNKGISYLEYSRNPGPVDILVFGDSFANLNDDNSFQNWIASTNNMTVVTVPDYVMRDSVQTFIVFFNSGLIDVIKPRIVLIETVERMALGRINNFNYFDTDTPEAIRGFYNGNAARAKKSKGPRHSFINTGNVKFLLYSVLYQYSDSAFFSGIHVMPLSAPLFSKAPGDSVAFYDLDVERACKVTTGNIEVLNAILNSYSYKLSEKNIKLYFMPVVDKYNLYSDYIIGNPYPRSIFFEYLRAFSKKYECIDTKQILSEALRRGEKDIFYADDTHWSWKACREIFGKPRFR